MIECNCGQCERLRGMFNNLVEKLKKYTYMMCPGCKDNTDHTWNPRRKTFSYRVEIVTDAILIRECDASRIRKILEDL